MARKEEIPPLRKLANMARELASAIQSVTIMYEPGTHKEFITDIVHQLSNSRRTVEDIATRFERMQRLVENGNGTYVMIDPDGNMRQASNDEVLRLVMNYQNGNVLTIVRDYTLDDKGNWQRRA